MSLPTRPLLIVVSVLSIALAGCGGGSDKGGGGDALSPTAYKKQVQAIGNDFKSQVSDAQTSLSGAKTNAARATGLGKIRVAFSDIATKIDRLKPPSGAQDEQDKLVSVLKTGAKDIGKVESAIKKNDVSGIQSSVSKIQTDSTDAGTALDDLQKAVDKKK
jgi:hypothetical protein